MKGLCLAYPGCFEQAPGKCWLARMVGRATSYTPFSGEMSPFVENVTFKTRPEDNPVPALPKGSGRGQTSLGRGLRSPSHR